jgi:hypothetical protein
MVYKSVTIFTPLLLTTQLINPNLVVTNHLHAYIYLVATYCPTYLPTHPPTYKTHLHTGPTYISFYKNRVSKVVGNLTSTQVGVHPSTIEEWVSHKELSQGWWAACCWFTLLAHCLLANYILLTSSTEHLVCKKRERERERERLKSTETHSLQPSHICSELLISKPWSSHFEMHCHEFLGFFKGVMGGVLQHLHDRWVPQEWTDPC